MLLAGDHALRTLSHAMQGLQELRGALQVCVAKHLYVLSPLLLLGHSPLLQIISPCKKNPSGVLYSFFPIIERVVPKLDCNLGAFKNYSSLGPLFPTPEFLT